jgi:hypothetical protein
LRLLEQLRTPHAVRFTGTKPPVLLHPPLCRDSAYSCPFTHAAEAAPMTQLGTGTYEANLDFTGRLSVGQAVPYLDTSQWISTQTTVLSQRGRANGKRVRL